MGSTYQNIFPRVIFDYAEANDQLYYIPLCDDKHRFVETTRKSALEIRDKIQSETKSKNFFSDNNFF